MKLAINKSALLLGTLTLVVVGGINSLSPESHAQVRTSPSRGAQLRRYDGFFSGSGAPSALGQPFDSVHDSVLPSPCVEPIRSDSNAATPASVAAPAAVGDATRCAAQDAPSNMRFSLYLARDRFELARSFGMSANFSAQGPAGVWGAEASAQYVSRQSDRYSSTYLVVETSVEFATARTPMRITNQAQQLWRSDRTGRSFLNQCGDGYVDSITRGSRFRAVLKFDSRESHQELQARFGMTGRYGRVQASVSSATDLTQKLSSMRYQVEVLQQGGAARPVPTDIAALIDEARTFVCTASTNPAVVGFTVQPYSTAAGGGRMPNHLRYYEAASLVMDRYAEFSTEYAEAVLYRSLFRDRWRDSDDGDLNMNDITNYIELLDRSRSSIVSQLTACERGAAAQCMAPLPRPPRFPRIRQVPIPGCSSYNSRGFCTRCDRSAPTSRQQADGSGPIDGIDCQLMEPGAHIRVTSSGSSHIESHCPESCAEERYRGSASVSGLSGAPWNVLTSPQLVYSTPGAGHGASGSAGQWRYDALGIVGETARVGVAISVSDSDRIACANDCGRPRLASLRGIRITICEDGACPN
jgi:hypothetical protein